MPITLTRLDEVALLTLDRPSALNALDDGMLAELDRALDDVGASDARALLVTGAGGRAFCAGADVRALAAKPLPAQRRGLQSAQALLSRFDELSIPSIAVVDGVALGGGLELALACTFRIATATARFGFPEIRLGLIPGFGGTQRLGRVIGTSRALEWILSARVVEASEALAAGLVSRIVERDPMPVAIDFARQFTPWSLRTSWLARQAVLRAHDAPLAEGLKTELDLATIALCSADATEGMSAFLAKRKPVFVDR